MRNSGVGLKMHSRVPIMKNAFNGQCNENNFDGFKMHIHSSIEVAHVKKHFIHIPYDHDVQITVIPRIMSTTQNVIDNYRPTQRKSIDQRENDLEFFKTYSQANCRLNELAIQVERTCKCVLYFTP